MIKTGSLTAYAMIAGTVLFTVYGQLVLKWQVATVGPMPAGPSTVPAYMLRVLLNPWIVSGLAAGFLAFFCWVGAVGKLPLSYAYPFQSLSFVLVVLLSGVLFGEALPATRVVGVVVILLGVLLCSRV